MTDIKKPLERGFQQLRKGGTELLDSPTVREYRLSANENEWVDSTTAKFLCKCKKMAISRSRRRSFHAARQSSVINLSRPEQPITLITVKPIRPLRGGKNSGYVTIVVMRQGAVLAAVGKCSLILDWRKVLHSRGHIQPLIRQTVLRIKGSI